MIGAILVAIVTTIVGWYVSRLLRKVEQKLDEDKNENK